MAIDERELDDASLVQAAQAGDDEAFAELFRRHYATVRRICTRRMGDPGEADEVTQAAFVRAYERIHQCGGERRFGAWVQVIAYRLVSDERRMRSRTMVSMEPIAADAALGPDSCVDAVLRAERRAEVEGVLLELPPRQREVIVARDLEGRRPGEIAASLGLSLGAVDSLLLRARRRMASAWQAAAAEHGATSVQVTTGSLVASTTVSESHPLVRWFSALGNAIDRASVHLAGVLGVVPSSAPAGPRVASLVLSGALIATPAAIVARPVHASPVTPRVSGLVGSVRHPSPPALVQPSLSAPSAAPAPSPPAVGWSMPAAPTSPAPPNPAAPPTEGVSAVTNAVHGAGGAGVALVAPVVATAVATAGQVASTAVSSLPSLVSVPSSVLPIAPAPSSTPVLGL